MSTRPLLEGHFDTEQDKLQREITRLKEDNAHLRERLSEEKSRADGSLVGTRRLRRIVEPLYDALRQIMGETEGLVGEEELSDVSPVKKGVWEDIKRRVGGKQAEVIDHILKLGPMSRGQLRAATGSGWSTIDAVIKNLREKGIILKRDGKWSLKEL